MALDVSSSVPALEPWVDGVLGSGSGAAVGDGVVGLTGVVALGVGLTGVGVIGAGVTGVGVTGVTAFGGSTGLPPVADAPGSEGVPVGVVEVDALGSALADSEPEPELHAATKAAPASTTACGLVRLGVVRVALAASERREEGFTLGSITSSHCAGDVAPRFPLRVTARKEEWRRS